MTEDTDKKVTRSTQEIVEFLADTEPSAVINALLRAGDLPTYYAKPPRKAGNKAEQKLSRYGLTVSAHDMLVADAICADPDSARWNALGSHGRFLFSMFAMDWPADSAVELLDYVQRIVDRTRTQESLNTK